MNKNDMKQLVRTLDTIDDELRHYSSRSKTKCSVTKVAALGAIDALNNLRRQVVSEFNERHDVNVEVEV